MTGKSLTWDHNTSQFVLDAKVSSSVGFKGEGGELTGIDTDQVTEQQINITQMLE